MNSVTWLRKFPDSVGDNIWPDRSAYGKIKESNESKNKLFSFWVEFGGNVKGPGYDFQSTQCY